MNLVDKAYNYSFDSLLKYIEQKNSQLPPIGTSPSNNNSIGNAASKSSNHVLPSLKGDSIHRSKLGA